jgi:cytoskeleton protein RodZ
MFNGTGIRDARESRSITLQQASRDLSIPENALRALELSDLNALPPEFFASGFLRSYCRYLELPAEGYLQSLRDTYARKESGARQRRFHPVEQLRQIVGGLRMPLPPEILSWALITVLLLSGWLAYTAVFEPQADPASSQVSAATVDLRLPETALGD